jgi:homoserine O-succinyltransferase/O-acetyltransferase
MGLCLINDPDHRALYMFNHIEYDTRSLAEEYERDVIAAKDIALPANYYPDNNPKNSPPNRWRAHAHLLFGNWINEVYQTTPFDLANIGKK